MSEANGRIRLSFSQIAWAISMLLGVGAAWMDLRIQVTRAEERATRIEEKVDRLRRDLDDTQQTNNYILDRLGGRLPRSRR